MSVTEFDAVAVDRRIGTNIKILAKARGETMKDVATRVGLSYSAINERLVGKRHFLAHEVEAFAAELEVEVAELYREPLSRFSAVSRSSSIPWYSGTASREAA